MIERDIAANFWDVIEEIRPSYIFIDFLEERFDIVEYMGAYITKSDAFNEMEPMIEDIEIIPRDGDVCGRLWRESCLRFIDRLHEQHPLIHIVLIKNYLSERVGDIFSQQAYENLVDIQHTNNILKEYYHFFERNCNGLQIIEASDCNYYYTDKQYEYGAVPSHLNEVVNDEIAKRIEKMIGL